MKRVLFGVSLFILYPFLCSAEIFVGGYDNGSITVYNNTDSGNVFPLRNINGSNTCLDTSDLESVFVDEVNNEIFAVNYDLGTITVYPLSANGNFTPTRTLTGLNGPGDVVVDTVPNELFVACYGSNSILVFSRTASGAASPLRTISGGSTGLDGA
jgi:DNA-binding beta-propeller fold protein YncE